MGCGGGGGGFFRSMITTPESDVETTTDNKAHFGHCAMALLLLGPSLWVSGFMGLFVWAHIGLIAPAVIIGLAIWACGHYGTNDSLWRRITYRTTTAQRDRIRRRLSDAKKLGKNV